MDKILHYSISKLFSLYSTNMPYQDRIILHCNDYNRSDVEFRKTFVHWQNDVGVTFPQIPAANSLLLSMNDVII